MMVVKGPDFLGAANLALCLMIEWCKRMNSLVGILGIDKLTEKSQFWLRFVLAHKIQLVDYHSNLFFNRV